MKYNKQKMIDKLERAKEIVNEVHDKTGISECGDVLCSIDEAICAIEDADES